MRFAITQDHKSRISRFVRLGFPVLAVFVRLGFGFMNLQDAPADPDRYIELATSLSEGRGFVIDGRPTAYRPPLYPLVLAPLTRIFGTGKTFHASVVVIQALLGGATVVLAMRASVRISESLALRDPASSRDDRYGSPACWIAGCVTALDPVLVSQSPLIMTETLAAFLLTGAIHAIVHDRFRCAGFWFGASVLCRPSLLVCFAATMAARMIAKPPESMTRRLIETARFAACCGLVIFPWGLRNQIHFGEPILTTTHGGYTLALANNRIYYDDVVFGPPGAVWKGPRQQAWMDAIGTDTVGLPEPEADRRIKAKALGFISDNPGEFVTACVKRQLRFWALAPAPQVYGNRIRWICTIWTLPIWTLVLTSLCFRVVWSWPTITTIAICAGLAAVHVVYWTDIRMRAPIVPNLAILAGVGGYLSLRLRET